MDDNLLENARKFLESLPPLASWYASNPLPDPMEVSWRSPDYI